MKEITARQQLQEKVQKVFQEFQKILIKAGTGSGKSKLSLELAAVDGKDWIILVPRTPLFRTWLDEMKKWGFDNFEAKSTILCYASAHKLQPTTSEGHNIILDEAHRVTERTWPYIKAMLGNKGKLICLSATVPYEKKDLLELLGIETKHTVTYSLDSAVKDNLVSDYRIQVVQFPLDNTSKEIEAGKVGAKFMVTEEQGYRFADQRARQSLYGANDKVKKFMMLARMRFIYNLPSKLKLAGLILNQIPADKRVLIFAGSILHANAVCPYRYHSKTDETDYKAFCESRINRLAVVQSVAEGVNIPEIDYALLMQVQSQELHTIQKIGRSIRKTNDPNKCSKIFILEATGTQDTRWVVSAIESFDPTKVDYVSSTQVETKGLTL